MVDVAEVAANVSGTINGRYMITEMVDDPIKRDYGVYNVYDHENPEIPTQAYIANPGCILVRRHNVQHSRWRQSMAATQMVLETVRGRSLHFPKLVKAGRVRRLVFGAEGVQEFENDPDCHRTVIIIKSPLPYQLLSHFVSFSPTGTLPVDLALHIGMGMVRALAALHRSGFVHRLVSPHSFSYITPPTIDNLVNRLIITDLSLCMPWPIRPRTVTPFIGSMRYSALRVHEGREQGPSTDIQSVVFVVAELISGRQVTSKVAIFNVNFSLAWRSVVRLNMACEMKELFPETQEFRRLPREIRALYRDMMLTSSQSVLDYNAIQGAFKSALDRRSQSKSIDLPMWLYQPCDE
ncbi:hypothetical protein M3Y98_00855900 [Aphelenchoides besseyi]|nr:hypothetical protein M3Y98_00855900 [Aphelenchoides besseyi]